LVKKYIEKFYVCLLNEYIHVIDWNGVQYK